MDHHTRTSRKVASDHNPFGGGRDCHVTLDRIIIHRKTADELILARTGTHADLFE
jgi:mRNA-degrading endonuclease YafQ of YafQ-DinJ toxin-antitoxin module